jgi:hypothetical protein
MTASLRHARRRLLAVLTGVAALGAFGLAPVAAQAATTTALPSFTWSKGVHEQEPPYAFGVGIAAMSCASPKECVALDQQDGVLTSANPTGGAAAWHVTPDSFPVTNTSPQWRLTCVTDKPVLCVAVAGSRVLVSTNPAGGKTTWHQVLSSVQRAASISCPTASFCLGSGAGGFEESTDPAGGAKDWHAVVIGKGTGSFQASCPTAKFCAATDGTTGDILTSTDPSGGASAWKVHDVNGPVKMGSIACPSASLCVASDTLNEILTSAHPTGAVSSWKRVTIGAELSSITCPTTTACFGLTPDPDGEQEELVASSDPTGAASAWQSSLASWFVVNYQWTPPLTCPSATLCVSGTLNGDVATSADPLGGLSTFGQPVSVDGSNGLVQVICLSVKLCLADDSVGHLLMSTDPAAGKWAFTSVTTTELACPSESLCVGTDGPDIVTSTDPAGGASTWHSGLADPGDPDKMIDSLQCASASLCYAQNQQEQFLISTDPAGGASTWQQVDPTGSSGGIFATAAFNILYCRNAQLCVLSGYNGTVYTSTDPTVTSSWQHYVVNSENKPVGPFTCPSASLCVGTQNIDERPNLITTTDPTGPSADWQVFEPSAVGTYFGVPVCASTKKCQTPGFLNHKPVIWTSTDPAGGAATYRSASAKKPVIVQPYCPTSSFCISVSGLDVVVSTTRLAQAGAYADEPVPTAKAGLAAVSCVRTALCVAVGGAYIYAGTLKKG